MTDTTSGKGTVCIWCGQRTDEDETGASFLFLAKRDSVFQSAPAHWLDNSPHIEGHQFFCHVRCFRASVPTAMQPMLDLALDDE
jgi:hypothetical protein